MFKNTIKCYISNSDHTLYQDMLPEGATLVLMLLGVDEICLSQLGNVTAHPLYVTIENLPKNSTKYTTRMHMFLLHIFPSLSHLEMSHVSLSSLRPKRSCARLYEDSSGLSG